MRVPDLEWGDIEVILAADLHAQLRKVRIACVLHVKDQAARDCVLTELAPLEALAAKALGLPLPQ